MEEKRDIIITRTDKNSWDYITYEGLRLILQVLSISSISWDYITYEGLRQKS